MCVRRTVESTQEAEWLCSRTAGGREVLDHNLLSFWLNTNNLLRDSTCHCETYLLSENDFIAINAY